MSTTAGSDWNKHNGVGATLLENWVEERATHDFIIQERKEGHQVDRKGHKNILASPESDAKLETTFQDSYKQTAFDAQFNKRQGRVKELLQRKWTDEILKEIEEEEKKAQKADPVDFQTVFMKDFSQKGMHQNIQYLGQVKPSKEKLAEYQYPITFWTEHASKNDGSTICSITGTEFRKLEQGKVVSFGKHAAFSTPVQEYQGEIPK